MCTGGRHAGLPRSLKSYDEGTHLSVAGSPARRANRFPCANLCLEGSRRANGDDADATDAQILELIQRVGSRFRWAHIEKLQEFDGAAGYTKAQGED